MECCWLKWLGTQPDLLHGCLETVTRISFECLKFALLYPPIFSFCWYSRIWCVSFMSKQLINVQPLLIFFCQNTVVSAKMNVMGLLAIRNRRLWKLAHLEREMCCTGKTFFYSPRRWKGSKLNWKTDRHQESIQKPKNLFLAHLLVLCIVTLAPSFPLFLSVVIFDSLGTGFLCVLAAFTDPGKSSSTSKSM